MPYLDTTDFIEMLNSYPGDTIDALYAEFKDDIEGMQQLSVPEALAEELVNILKTAANTKRGRPINRTKASSRDTTILSESSGSASDRIADRILESGKAMATAWGSAIEALADEMDEKAKSEKDDSEEPERIEDETSSDNSGNTIVLKNGNIYQQNAEKIINNGDIENLTINLDGGSHDR